MNGYTDRSGRSQSNRGHSANAHRSAPTTTTKKKRCTNADALMAAHKGTRPPLHVTQHAHAHTKPAHPQTHPQSHAMPGNVMNVLCVCDTNIRANCIVLCGCLCLAARVRHSPGIHHLVTSTTRPPATEHTQLMPSENIDCRMSDHKLRRALRAQGRCGPVLSLSAAAVHPMHTAMLIWFRSRTGAHA